MATHSKTRTAVQRIRRAARRLRAREMQRERQGHCTASQDQITLTHGGRPRLPGDRSHTGPSSGVDEPPS